MARTLEPLCVKSCIDLSETPLVHRNLSLCTVTFGEKVLTLSKSHGYGT